MIKLHNGDCLEVLKTLEPESINCCVTSPPYYGLRDYGIPPTEWPEIEFYPMPGMPAIKIPAQRCCLGLEKDPVSFIGHCVYVFRDVSRVLRDDGTLWLNLGDSYHGGGSTTKNGQNTRLYESKSTLQSKHTEGSCNRRPKPRGYPGYKPKDLIGIPWKVAFALQADGWYLRQDIIWSKPNPMPESVKDRCTKAHEYIFLLSKSSKYYYDHEAIKESCSPKTNNRTSKSEIKRIAELRAAGASTSCGSGRKSAKVHTMDGMVKQNESFENACCLPVECRNKRSVWTIEDHNSLIQWLSETNPELLKEYFDTTSDVWTVATKPFKEAHFATFPPDLIKPCILAGCPEGGTVLDNFSGAGTVGKVSKENGRNFIGIDIKSDYLKMSEKRIEKANYQLGF
jgi:DNA modification methylase